MKFSSTVYLIFLLQCCLNSFGYNKKIFHLFLPKLSTFLFLLIYLLVLKHNILFVWIFFTQTLFNANAFYKLKMQKVRTFKPFFCRGKWYQIQLIRNPPPTKKENFTTNSVPYQPQLGLLFSGLGGSKWLTDETWQLICININLHFYAIYREILYFKLLFK